MILIDTHCHLTHNKLKALVQNVIKRADEAGVMYVICAAGDLEESQQAQTMAHRFSRVYCMAGVHPHEAQNAPGGYLQKLEDLAANPKNVAIGEIGLDYHYNFSPPETQRKVFTEQLELAKRLASKIVVHTREAFADTLSILQNSGVSGDKLVFHSCTEDPQNVRKLLDLGAMISFSGIVTFRSTESLRQAAATVPDDRLLIETDAPYLSPEPVRKMHVNEPANVVHVAECLASVRNQSLEKLAEITTANARRFFGI